MQLVFLLAQCWHINVVQAMQAHRPIKPLRFNILYDDREPLRPSQPVLHREELRVRSLASWTMESDVFRGFCSADEMVEKTRTVGLGEENRTVILALFRRHVQWVVSQLVGAVVVGVDGQRVGARPCLPVDDGVQHPGGVRAIVDGQVANLLGADNGSEVQDLSKPENNIN